MHALNNNVNYFASVGVEQIPKEIEKFIIQAYDSVRCGYFCNGFIDLMLKGKSLKDFPSLLSPNKKRKSIINLLC